MSESTPSADCLVVVGAGFVIDSVFLQKTRMALGTGKNIAVTENEREFCT